MIVIPHSTPFIPIIIKFPYKREKFVLLIHLFTYIIIIFFSLTDNTYIPLFKTSHTFVKFDSQKFIIFSIRIHIIISNL